MAKRLPGLDLTVKETSALFEAEREELGALFQSSYRQANPTFREKWLETLRWAALTHQGGEPVGFGLGEVATLESTPRVVFISPPSCGFFPTGQLGVSP